MPLRRPRNDSFDNARRMVEVEDVVDVEVGVGVEVGVVVVVEELIKGGIYGIVITGFEGAYRG